MKILLILLLCTYIWSDKPNLFLLNTYTDDKNISGWYMSEKLDGVRAYWDGEKLISRGGKVFNPPTFFIKNFPKHKLDGELWSKRNDFENISSIVKTKKSNEKWKELTYNIFEVPSARGSLLQRLSNVKETKYLKLIKQIKVKNKEHLKEFLSTIEKQGGEGVVVRDGSLPYYTGRDNNSLKVKSYQDAECKVVSFNNGNGKYKNKLGSLNCKLKSDKIIKIGSGFSDKQRKNPPKIGSIITFKYYGLTSKGNPKFPVFLRQRDKTK
ncbi:DNA ligase [Sulfurimonas lithotrophica]|uniref:DNA ligase n=1 Tax=Sulfurimonas lithotrophica TaxID=2590022 RepID=A0A5P8NZJ0_9BACT|nr:DNA ligase [Sulfurimonas lithotrophica]QFR48869.1 DNA ligase [Sulfurimonas lithotrophica]